LTHSYNSTLTINRFNTGLDYLRTVDNGARNELNGDFYARLEIPEIAIQESFAPFIALDMTLNNGMSMNIDYKKARTLALSFINNQLNETQTKEIAIGFGYLMKDVDIPFLTGSKKKKGRGKKKKEEEEQQQNNRNNRNNRGGGRNQLEGKDLDINFNFSLRDDVTFAHIIDAQQSEPTRGTYSLSLSPSAEYKLNQRLSLRLFFDYRRNVPKTSAGFPRTDTSGGVVVRFQLN
jgi:cell surface protein SprA